MCVCCNAVLNNTLTSHTLPLSTLVQKEAIDIKVHLLFAYAAMFIVYDFYASLLLDLNSSLVIECQIAHARKLTNHSANVILNSVVTVMPHGMLYFFRIE